MLSTGTGKWPKLHQKKAMFFAFCRVKPPFGKLVEVWRALSCDHPLCDITPKCHSQSPGFSFGKTVIVLSYSAFIPQNLYFWNFQVWKTTLIWFY